MLNDQQNLDYLQSMNSQQNIYENSETQQFMDDIVDQKVQLPENQNMDDSLVSNDNPEQNEVQQNAQNQSEQLVQLSNSSIVNTHSDVKDIIIDVISNWNMTNQSFSHNQGVTVQIKNSSQPLNNFQQSMPNENQDQSINIIQILQQGDNLFSGQISDVGSQYILLNQQQSIQLNQNNSQAQNNYLNPILIESVYNQGQDQINYDSQNNQQQEHISASL